MMLIDETSGMKILGAIRLSNGSTKKARLRVERESGDGFIGKVCGSVGANVLQANGEPETNDSCGNRIKTD